MKILVVDDEIKIADILSERLNLRGFQADPVYDGSSALTRLQNEVFDGIILDLRLPDIDGLEILRRTRKNFPHIQVIVISGHGNDQLFQRCLALGATACFRKPLKINSIIEAFQRDLTHEDATG